MSDIIRLDITGKQADAWNRAFGSFADVIERAVEHLAPNMDEPQRQHVHDLTQDIADITKNYIKAKLECPALENELKLAKIAAKFEELKTKQAERKQIEVDTEIKQVTLEKERLDLWDRRLVLAFKWLGFLENHVVRSPDGTVTLILSNRDLSALRTDIALLQGTDPESKQGTAQDDDAVPT